MKKIIAAFLAVAFIIGSSACGSSQANWQEQYDLGVRYLSEGNYEEAVLAFTAAIEIDAKQADAYIGLADAYMGMGDAEQAIAALNEGLSAIPDDAELQDRLSEMEQTSGVNTEPVTISDYAKIYYQYIQEIMIPNGDQNGNQFIDADMVDIENDGTLELIVSTTNDLWIYDYSDLASQSENAVSMSYKGLSGVAGNMWVFINNYNDEKCLFSYTEFENKTGLLVFTLDGKFLGNGLLDIGALGGGISGSNDSYMVNKSTQEQTSLTLDEANAMIEQYLHPSSTFCHVPFGEPPAFAENTHGERLKEYFE